MDYTLAQLTQFGFNVKSESFRCTADGNIAQGTYYLNYDGDEEIGMMFAWSNSYNKQIKFKCAIGGYVFVCLNGMLCGDMGSWGRKHTGTADVEAQKTIADQISNAQVYYDRLITDKNIMKEIVIDSKRQAELLGVLFAEYEILTTEQMSLVKQQMDKPSYFYNGDVNSLWSFYNHVTLSLKKSHPRNWMEDQRKLHWFLSMEFDLENFQTIEVTELLIDPLTTNYGEPENQTNLLVQIAEETGDNSILQAQPFIIEKKAFENITNITVQYPLTPEDAFQKETIPELTENELASQLYGVDNNIEVIHDLDAEEDQEWEDFELAGTITPIEYKAENSVVGNDLEIKYQDPAGNIFEAPIVQATLKPTPEEFLLIEEEINQEIIEEEALFDVSKMEIVANNDFDFDLDLDTDEEVKTNTDGYFL
jgi:hypothetical protein